MFAIFNTSLAVPPPKDRSAMLVVVLLSVSLTGCLHVKTIEAPDGIDQLNIMAQRRTVLVRFIDGTSAFAEELNMDPQNTRWIDPRTGQPVFVATSEISEIHVKDRANGMFDGLGLGILAGASLGLMVGLSMRATETEQVDPDEHPTASAGMAGGMLGGSLGMLIGGVQGATQCYRFAGPGERRPTGR